MDDLAIWDSLPDRLRHLEVIYSSPRLAVLENYMCKKTRYLRHLTFCGDTLYIRLLLFDLKERCPELQSVELQASCCSCKCNIGEVGEPPSAMQIPTWPTSLQSIKISILQVWTKENAEILLISLISAAPNLPRLREIHIIIDLSMDRRAGIAFKQEWNRLLRAVFHK